MVTGMQVPQETTPLELQLLPQMRGKLKDLRVDKYHLEDKNLLRFLRARNHSLENAVVMFRKQIEWRQKQKLDTLIKWQVPPEYSKIYWPCYMTGFDLLGNPVIIVALGRWDPSKVSVISYDTYVRYHIWNLEAAWQIMRHLSRGEKRMKQGTFIIDMQGLGWRNITTIDSVQAGNEVLKYAEANYPELLNVGFLLNAPYIFNIAYKIIKPFLSEYTQSKLQLLPGSDINLWRNEISKYIAVDQFPQKYGGELADSLELDIETPWTSSSKSGPAEDENVIVNLKTSYKNL